MKKIIVITIALMFIASMASAVSITNGGNGGGSIETGSSEKEADTVIAVLSNNVYADIVSSVGQFAAITKHVNGSKNYATSSESTKINWILVTDTNEKTATFEITLSNSDTTDFSAWDAL